MRLRGRFTLGLADVSRCKRRIDVQANYTHTTKHSKLTTVQYLVRLCRMLYKVACRHGRAFTSTTDDQQTLGISLVETRQAMAAVHRITRLWHSSWWRTQTSTKVKYSSEQFSNTSIYNRLSTIQIGVCVKILHYVTHLTNILFIRLCFLKTVWTLSTHILC